MDRETKIRVAKFVVGKFGTFGAGIITSAIIANHVPTDNNLLQKAAVFVGGVAIAMIVKDAVHEKTDKTVDDFVNLYDQLRSKTVTV